MGGGDTEVIEEDKGIQRGTHAYISDRERERDILKSVVYCIIYICISSGRSLLRQQRKAGSLFG